DLMQELVQPKRERRKRAELVALALCFGDRLASGSGARVRHVGGSKYSFTVEPLGNTVPAGGSWRESRPVPSTVGLRPSPIAALTASRAGKPARSGTRASPGRIGAEGVTTPTAGASAARASLKTW